MELVESLENDLNEEDLEICDDLEIDDFEEEFTVLRENTLVPKVGNFLGLDVSESSTGVCLYRGGKKKTFNITLNKDDTQDHYEVLMRRDLKRKLLEVIKGISFEVIVIEDVFVGENPKIARELYAINTAIDELILDGCVKCKTFVRVSNKQWKSWLSVVDTVGITKGLNDKVKIQKWLSMLGIEESGEGFQDRLDATGMLLGYLIFSSNPKNKIQKIKKKRVVIDDVEWVYMEDEESALLEAGYYSRDEFKSMHVTENRWSKSKMLDYLTDKPDFVVITSNPVYLGRLASDLKLGVLENGGYFCFWVKPKRLKKYLCNIEEESK